MALCAVKKVHELSGTTILAAERYDPRRECLVESMGALRTIPLGELVSAARITVNPTGARGDQSRYLVLDTSDAREGILVCRKSSVDREQIGSVKKEVQLGDVIISRLRPYLRQVALVDKGMRRIGGDAKLVCSTEFFVLRPVDEESIAFLVPYLLDERVQRVLAASQEGGHHPRFSEATLLTLMVPHELVKQRAEVSAEVEESVALHRSSEALMLKASMSAEASL